MPMDFTLMEDPYSNFLITSIYPHVHAYIHDRFPMIDMQLLIRRGKMSKLHTEYQELVCKMILECMPDTSGACQTPLECMKEMSGMNEAFFMERVMMESAMGRISNERFIHLTRQWIELVESCYDPSTMS
jgi:hypothetical protein